MERSILLLILLLSACADKEPEETGCEYEPPVAVLTYELGPEWLLTLDGSGSYGSCGHDELAYTWSFEYVPVGSGVTDEAFGEHNGTTQGAVVDFVLDVIGDYTVMLTVSDGVGVSDPAYLFVEFAAP